jgi:hypothetical protein
MPEIKNNFLKGKMNKDLDDRLLPPGEYRDAQNIEVLKTDGSNVGVLQNAAGNSLAHTALNLSTDIDVIGTYFDEKNKRIYWFLTDNNDLYENDWYINSALNQNRFHAIYYYDADPSSNTYKTAKEIVGGSFLKFSKKYKITGIAMIDDLLFWTDNKNQPRRINVVKAISNPSFYDNELKISLAKYAPYIAPILMTDTGIAGTSTMTNDANIDNDYIEEEFVRFSYRFKFNDNEYSVLAPFSQIAFKHSYKSGSEYGEFGEAAEIRAYESTELDGMINNTNKVVIGVELPSINPNADFEIKEIEFIIKESDSTVARVLETKTLTDANISSTFYNYTYKSDTPQNALPEDQITRVFDNVPTKAKALDIVGNRLVFGNYSQNIEIPTLDYNVSYGAKGTQTFTGNAIETEFTLTIKSPVTPDQNLIPNNTNQFNVYINDVLLASTEYGYDGTTGVITFNTAPANGALITVVLANHEYPDSSLKQRRTYQVGVILADIFGRQSPVLLPTTVSDSIITIPARGTAAEFNSWIGDNLKITFNAQNGKLIPDDNVYSNELSSGIYATYNPYGWYSYKIVVKQLEQDYYNIYTPGATVVDNNSYITLFGDNINKVPRLLETIGETAIAKSDVLLYPKIINTAFYTTTTSTTGTRSAATGGTTTTTSAMIYSCNQYQIFNRDTNSARTFTYVPCNSTIASAGDLVSSAVSVSLAAGKKQKVWSLTFPELNANADVGFLEITQLTFNKVQDANAATGYSEIEFTDPSSGQIIKTIEFNSVKLAQSLVDIDEIPILGIGKLSDFNSITIDTIQEFTRSSQVYDDAGGPFYQSQNNHLIAQLPPYDITSNRSDALGVRMLFTDDTATDNTLKPDLSITSYIKRGKYIDLAVFETLPVESTIDIFYETSTSGKINELNALETGEFTSANVTISDFAVAQDGEITAPSINVGSLQSVEYVNAVPDAAADTDFRYFAVSTNTNRIAKLIITAPNGYTNAGTNIIISTTVQQDATPGLNTTVPLFSDLSLVSTTATGGSNASLEVSATISNNGNAVVTARGFRIGTTNIYGDAENIPDLSGGIGTYTATKTDASINSLYYVWAWATNSVGTNVQGPIEVTTPELGEFTVAEWTGTISVASNGNVTTVAGNSPEVLYAGTVSPNPSSTDTVQVTLGKSDGDANSYSSADNTIRIQVPTTGYTNSGANVYLYTAVRTVTQPASTGGTYTIAQHAVPSGFSISPTGVFTQGTIQQGTLNSVSLNGSPLTNGQSTNISVVNSATLRTLTLNITPGGSFTNPLAADFTFNIVQPSREVASTGIPSQSTVINSTQTIDLRNYYSNTSGKFFEITSNSATGSLISASIINNYQLQLIGQGSCTDISGTTSAGSIVIKAYNEKAVTDGSVAGSTAAVSPTEAGTDSFSETVNLSVTACASPTASLTMSFNSGGSNLASGVSLSSASSRTYTYNTSDIGSSFTNQMQFTFTHASINLTSGMVSSVSNTGGFSYVVTENGDNSITIGFSGTNPNQSANNNINYSFDITITTSVNYVSAIGFTMTNAGYAANPSVISASGAANTNNVSMNTSTITASPSGTFTSDPVIYYQGQNPTATNYIQVTSHSSGNPFTLTASRQNNNTEIAISGTANILSGDTSGYANVVLVPNTGVQNTVTGMTVHGVNVQSGGTGSHYTVNKSIANTTIPFTVSGTGNISVAVSNASVSGSVVNLNTTSGYGNFSGTCSIGTGAGSGTFTLTATPTGGTPYSITVSVQRITNDGTGGIVGYEYSAAQSSIGSTQGDGYPSICDISYSTGNKIYTPGSWNVGDTYYDSTEAAQINGTQQGNVFAGNNQYYKVKRIYAFNNAYIPLASQTFYVQINNSGVVQSIISCGNNHDF